MHPLLVSTRLGPRKYITFKCQVGGVVCVCVCFSLDDCQFAFLLLLDFLKSLLQ
jgi:hypothetical protein